MDNGSKLNDKAFKFLKHDIKNQLNNIQLALEALRYDVSDTDPNLKLYMDCLAESARKIDELLNKIE